MSTFPITRTQFDDWVQTNRHKEDLATAGDGRTCPVARCLWDRGYRDQEVTAEWKATGLRGKRLSGSTPLWACIFAALVDERFEGTSHLLSGEEIAAAWRLVPLP